MSTLPSGPITRPGDYIARLDKATGLRVLCGYPTCIGEFGRILEYHDGRLRYLAMLDGFERSEDGAWELIAWAKGHIRSGHGSQARDRRAHIRTSTDPVTREKDTITARQSESLILFFPDVARCPRCKHRNVLDAGALRIAMDPDYVGNNA